MPAINTTKMTARQFLELGEDPPGVRLELVDGEIEVAPSPVPRHSQVVLELSHLLKEHIRKNDLGTVLGDVDTFLDEHNIRRPDVLFFSKNRLHLIGEKAIEGPPDLCVEVVSPSSATIDRKVKFELYEAAGVAHYWIIDPDARTFEAYSLFEGRYQRKATGREDDKVSAPPFEALEIPLSRLWL